MNRPAGDALRREILETNEMFGTDYDPDGGDPAQGWELDAAEDGMHMATEDLTTAGRLAAMADALDAAADVFEVGDWDAIFAAQDTLRDACDRYLPGATGTPDAIIRAVLRCGLYVSASPWLLRALALGLRRDADRLSIDAAAARMRAYTPGGHS